MSVVEPGGELDSTGQSKGKWRAVVGQQATQKADQKTYLPSLALQWLSNQAAPAEGLRRRGPKAGRQFRLVPGRVGHARDQTPLPTSLDGSPSVGIRRGETPNIRLRT